jgi:hypothetical protein
MKFSTTIAPLLLLLTAASWLPGQRTPDEALRALQEGNQRFAAGTFAAAAARRRRAPHAGARPEPVRGGDLLRRQPGAARAPLQHRPRRALRGAHRRPHDRRRDHRRPRARGRTPERAAVRRARPREAAARSPPASTRCRSLRPSSAPTATGLQQLLEQIEPAVRKVRHRDLGGKELCSACEEETRPPHRRTSACAAAPCCAASRRSARSRSWPPAATSRAGRSSGCRSGRCRPPTGDQAGAPLGSVPAGTPPHVALRMLQAGHRRFLGDGKPTADLGKARREALVDGQTPPVIVLTCADSRVAPSTSSTPGSASCS